MNKKTLKYPNKNTSNEYDFFVLKALNDTQKISQRQLSQSLNISLGKINYILKALIDKGAVKARNFKNNKA